MIVRPDAKRDLAPLNPFRVRPRDVGAHVDVAKVGIVLVTAIVIAAIAARWWGAS